MGGFLENIWVDFFSNKALSPEAEGKSISTQQFLRAEFYWGEKVLKGVLLGGKSDLAQVTEKSADN